MEKIPKTIAFVLPHPDDEALAFGLQAALTDMGQHVHLIALTKGDLGSHTIRSRRRIAAMRKKEFSKAGDLLKSRTTVFPFHDAELPFVVKKAERRLLRELRDIKADVVVTTSSHDYHDDHIAAHDIARWATFHMSDAPIKTRRLFRRIPPTTHQVAFYSMDTQGSQQWQNTKEDDGISTQNLHPINMILSVNEQQINRSVLAFKQHKSQLFSNMDYVELARRSALRRGAQAGFSYGVGLSFEPFGGYAFSTHNELATLFGPKRTKLMIS